MRREEKELFGVKPMISENDDRYDQKEGRKMKIVTPSNKTVPLPNRIVVSKR